MIVQGTNLPLILTFDEDASTFSSISVIMYPRNSTSADNIKSWTKVDMTIDDKEVICPLTQEDTLNLDITEDLNVAIEVKWMEEDGTIEHSGIFYDYISYRKDSTVLAVE